MEHPTKSKMETYLQTRLDIHDEKIEVLAKQMNSLTQSIHAMKDLINKLPKSIEKRIPEFQTPGGKPYLPNPKVETPLFKGPNNITGVFNEAPISTTDPRDWINRVELS